MPSRTVGFPPPLGYFIFQLGQLFRLWRFLWVRFPSRCLVENEKKWIFEELIWSGKKKKQCERFLLLVQMEVLFCTVLVPSELHLRLRLIEQHAQFGFSLLTGQAPFFSEYRTHHVVGQLGWKRKVSYTLLNPLWRNHVSSAISIPSWVAMHKYLTLFKNVTFCTWISFYHFWP